MKDFQCRLGQAQISMTADDELLLSVPLYVVNTGFYDTTHFNVSTAILNRNGSALAYGSTLVPVIEHGQTSNITHNMRLNLTDLSRAGQDLLFDDVDLTANLRIIMDAAQSIPVQASYNFSVPWGAPLHGLTFGMPEFTTYNTTHFRVTVPVSFENHAVFDVTGTVQVRMYNNANSLIGEEQIDIAVPQSSPYNGKLDLHVPLVAASGIRFEALFITPFFNYGPLAIPYGG